MNRNLTTTKYLNDPSHQVSRLYKIYVLYHITLEQLKLKGLIAPKMLTKIKIIYVMIPGKT